ncbi:CueP family metal-binding protein [Georgenia sp. Z1344]|uniref:CueP family metal-binding protein n=1 Tax=Georgenia sp. Z1344 TaxID=3416706 RepID=UPI003CE80AB5
MKRLAATIPALVLILAGCSTADTSDEQSVEGAEGEFLAAHGLDGMEVPEMIDHLDRLGGQERPTSYMASIRSEELLFSDGEQDLALDMPDDLFYLSVAPYVNQTHDCYYHSLTTCQGELTGQDIQVRILDQASGEELVNDEVTTFDNGFAGFWLPRDVEGTIEITYDGLTGTSDFSTADDGATCLTDLRLA